MYRTSQAGSALLISLVFLLLLTMIGVASIQDSTLQERMAGNERNRNVAFQEAEAALRAGERWLLGSIGLPSSNGAGGFISPSYEGPRPSDSNYDWEKSMSVGGNARYAVELIVTKEHGPRQFGELYEVGSYRVTARAEGATSDAVVILQSTVRR